MQAKVGIAGGGILAAALILGCSKAAHDMSDYQSPAAVPAEAVVMNATEPSAAVKSRGAVGGTMVSVSQQPDRKIIYSAEIELAVEDFAGVPERVIALVKAHEAYVADSGLTGSAGESRRGHWKIRVPVDQFEAFVSAARGLGELIDVNTNSTDVSEEYYDVDARIRNKTKEEERLLALLENRPGKLEDVISIERELSRVREEIERMQGRMRVLQDLTSLTTVDISIVEIRDYEPPQAPTLATRIRRTFTGSVSGLQAVGEMVLLAGVGISPWLPVGLVVVLPVYGLVRRQRKRLGRERQQAGPQSKQD